jgi:class 3 adenylate cyclase/tetratricopeptide (TPR) repeat protein
MPVGCARCQHENPDAARFCGGCGARLETVCPSCQAGNPPANRFCHQCGAPLGAAAAPADPADPAAPRAYTPRHLADKILATRSALEGERKQVTVLFVDVSGFTRLAAGLDPEDVHALMTRAFELMSDEVHRYEGTVNQFLGDGIMALFGAPIAHEDHARRAVHAALGIRAVLDEHRALLRRERDIDFRVRQGLNTGLVVVGSIGSDLRMDYTAVGDTTNVAARLLQAAAPGQIVISETVQRAVGGYFETEPLGELALKGKSEPVPAWLVVAPRGARTRLDVEAERGLTRFVGREREIEILEDCFGRAERGQGQVVLVVGEPGIGKSRLLREFQRRLGDRAGWLHGQCLSFGRAMAFHPLVDLLKRWFDIDDGDSASAIIEKIERGAAALDPDAPRITPYLRALLSVDPGDPAVATMSAAQRRGETLDALRRLLALAAARRPRVLLIEDLHWADAATEHFLTALVDGVPGIPAVLVFSYRPGYAQPFGERSFVTRVAPAALSTEDTARMAEDILESTGLPPALTALIAGKAEGNPFFVEEVVRSLRETGAVRLADGRPVLAVPVDQIHVPDTVQDVIAARIDRLPEEPKRALQVASVIGREFTRRLLGRLAEVRAGADAVLRDLAAIELIREKALFPELAYMFTHALTHDVAYGSLLVQRRRELHRLIGSAIEELYAERIAEHYEMLAHHFRQAEDWARALPYLLKAAEKAARASGLHEALALYAEALEAVRHLGDRAPLETSMEILSVRADLLYGIGEYGPSAAEAQRLAELARQAGDPGREAGALAQQAWAEFWREDFPAAHRLAAEAVRVGEPAKAEAALCGALFVKGYAHAVTGRLDEGEVEFEQSLGLARRARDFARQGLVLHMTGIALNWRGAYREGLAVATEGVRVSEEHRLVVPLSRGLWTQGVLLVGLGEYQAALDVLMRGLALVEKIGDPQYLARFLNTIGWLHFECGDLDRGHAMSARGLELARRSRHASGIERVAFTLINEADALIVMGDVQRAADKLDEAHYIAEHPPASRWMTWRYATHCLVSLGELALARGDPSGASSFADRSLEIAEPTRSRKYESRAWRLKGEVALARRAWDDALAWLRQALDIAQGIGEPGQTLRAHAALGRLHRARGEPDAARQDYRAGRALVERVLAGVSDAGLRSGLEASRDIREILAVEPGP